MLSARRGYALRARLSAFGRYAAHFFGGGQGFTSRAQIRLVTPSQGCMDPVQGAARDAPCIARPFAHWVRIFYPDGLIILATHHADWRTRARFDPDKIGLCTQKSLHLPVKGRECSAQRLGDPSREYVVEIGGCRSWGIRRHRISRRAFAGEEIAHGLCRGMGRRHAFCGAPFERANPFETAQRPRIKTLRAHRRHECRIGIPAVAAASAHPVYHARFRRRL